MLVKKGSEITYLENYRKGNIKPGLGIGNDLDNYLRLKQAQLNIILGHDNVGKSYFFSYYMLSHALINDKKFCIWSGENTSGQIMRDLIQMYCGNYFKKLAIEQIRSAHNFLSQSFTFVDNTKLYKPEDLFLIFESENADVCLIDPYTGLDRKMTYEGNYEFLNNARQFCNTTKKTLYISTHPTSESGRAGNLYPEKHEWNGHLKAPLKAHCEGGKSFLNRSDDLFILHRLCSHPTMKYETMLSVEKIKDRETGGQITELNTPLLFNFNNGLGFTTQGIDNLKDYRMKTTQTRIK